MTRDNWQVQTNQNGFHHLAARLSATIIASSCGSSPLLRADLKWKVDEDQSVAMNTKVHLYILGVAFSIGLLLCAAGTHGSPNKRRKNRPDAPKLEPKKLSITGYSSISRTPSDRSSVFRPRTKGSHVAPGSITARAVSAEKTRADIQSDFAYVPDVSVTCSTSDFVLRVKPGFYGLGADADELTLGNTCRSNGVLRPYGDLLFTYPLTACDAVRQRVRGFHTPASTVLSSTTC